MLFGPQKKRSKNSKKSTFCKGVSPWFLSKNRPIPHIFFWAKKARKKQFLIFWKEGRTWFFAKIRPSSYMFVLSKQSKKETYFDILDSKEFFLDLKSETLAKSKKSAFCKGVSPWFLSKNRPYSCMFFLSNKSQKEAFFDILVRK